MKRQHPNNDDPDDISSSEQFQEEGIDAENAQPQSIQINNTGSTALDSYYSSRDRQYHHALVRQLHEAPLKHKIVIVLATTMSVFVIVFIAVLLGVSVATESNKNSNVIISMDSKGGSQQELFFGDRNSGSGVPSMAPTFDATHFKTNLVLDIIQMPISSMFQNLTFPSSAANLSYMNVETLIPTQILSVLPSQIKQSNEPTQIASPSPSLYLRSNAPSLQPTLRSKATSLHPSSTENRSSSPTLFVSTNNSKSIPIDLNNTTQYNTNITLPIISNTILETTAPATLAARNRSRLSFAITSGHPEDASVFKENLSKLSSMDFFIHLGNWNQNIPNCSAQSYQHTSVVMKSFSPIPTFVTVGSHEINKCETATTGWYQWQKYLGKFDQNWNHSSSHITEYQEDNVANYAFEYQKVLVISLFLVEVVDDASNTWTNTWNTIMQMNKQWIQYHTRTKRIPNRDYDTILLLSNYNQFSLNGIAFQDFLKSWLDDIAGVTVLWIYADDTNEDGVIHVREDNDVWKVVSVGNDIWQVHVHKDQNLLDPFQFQLLS